MSHNNNNVILKYKLHWSIINSRSSEIQSLMTMVFVDLFILVIIINN